MPSKAPKRDWSPAVAKLLTLGPPGAPADLPENEPFNWSVEPLADYAALGLTAAHAAELARMAIDRTLIDGPDPDSFGPVHAARALVALNVPDAVPTLISALRLACPRDLDFWIEDMIGVHGLPRLGPAVIDPIAKVVRDQREDFGLRVSLLGALDELVNCPDHADQARPRVSAIFRDMLKLAAFTDPAINGTLINTLAHMRAVEALPEIRAAYATVNRSGRTRAGMGGVDELTCGTLEDIERYIHMSDLERLREQVKTSEKIITEMKEMIAGRDSPRPRLPLGDEADELDEMELDELEDEIDAELTEEDLQDAMAQHALLRAKLARAEREAAQPHIE